MTLQRKTLIITADDLGYSTERNQGITECYDAGAVSRSSLMVNAVAAEHGSQLAKKSGLPLGLHLNLTDGRPLTAGRSLVVPESGLMHNKVTIRELARAGALSLNEVRAEIRAQIAKFKELTGHKPLYVDGHQHAHIAPGITEVFAEEMVSHGIFETRLPAELGMENYNWIGQIAAGFYKEVLSNAAAAKPTFQEKGIKFPDRFVGLATMGRYMTIPRLQEMISAAYSTQTASSPSGVGSCELMVHPGYPCRGLGGCGDGPDEFAMSDDRLYEISVIKAGEMLQWYKSCGIQLVPSLD